jgi:hypothetical protein
MDDHIGGDRLGTLDRLNLEITDEILYRPNRELMEAISKG